MGTAGVSCRANLSVKPPVPCLVLAGFSIAAVYMGRSREVQHDNRRKYRRRWVLALQNHATKEKKGRRCPETSQGQNRPAWCLCSHLNTFLQPPKHLFKALQGCKLLAGTPRWGTRRGEGSACPGTKHGCSGAASMGEWWVPRASLAALCWDAPWGMDMDLTRTGPPEGKTPHSCFHPSFPKDQPQHPMWKQGPLPPWHMGTTGSALAGSGLCFCCQVSSCSNLWPPLSRIQPATARLFLITPLQTSKVQQRFV